MDRWADPLVPPTNVAAELGISTRTLSRMAQRGEIEIVRISQRRVGIRRSEIERVKAGHPRHGATEGPANAR